MSYWWPLGATIYKQKSLHQVLSMTQLERKQVKPSAVDHCGGWIHAWLVTNMTQENTS